MTAEDDIRFMRRALSLARARLGRVAPNPAVGCVIVQGGTEIAHGATGDGGRPHAEELALEAAGDLARAATAYVTLEPCAERSNHTASCARRLADARIARVVIAVGNPHAKTAGGGLDRLRAAGIELALGVCEEEARALNAGFFCLLETGRPLLVLGGDPASCDEPFAVRGRESPAEALDRLGAEGMTRVWAAPDNPLARALVESGYTRAIRG